jgi:cell division protein YceG involved in septum cleavage
MKYNFIVLREESVMLKKLVVNNNIMLISFAALVAILSFMFGLRFVHADKKVEYDKSFISIEVNNGDTLTSIAQDYAVSAGEYDSYISEVKTINNLESDTIHAGCYLLVPVYEIEE